MVKYFDELNKLVDQLPADCYSLRNIATVQSALAFSLAGEKDKSIEADKNSSTSSTTSRLIIMPTDVHTAAIWPTGI